MGPIYFLRNYPSTLLSTAQIDNRGSPVTAPPEKKNKQTKTKTCGEAFCVLVIHCMVNVIHIKKNKVIHIK